MPIRVPPGPARDAAGQVPGRNVHDVLLSSLSQRAMRAPAGVARHTVSPSAATTPRPRQVHSAAAASTQPANAARDNKVSFRPTAAS